MYKQTGRKTTISISEYTYENPKAHPYLNRKDLIIIHDGWEWHMGGVPNQSELKKMLNFLEIEITTIDFEKKYPETGKIVYYNLSKNINSPCDGGFWNLEQLKELSAGERLKKFKGLSNGSLVDCYAGIGKDVINIYRPNPNAKDVYKPMSLSESISCKKQHWYL